MKGKKPSESQLKFADKILDTLGDFLKFGIKNPGIFDKIPNNSYAALLPKWNGEFSKANLELVSNFAKKAKAVVVTFIGEKSRKLSAANLVFLKGVLSTNKQKLSKWHN